MQSRVFALLLSLIMFVAAVSAAHLKDGGDDLPVIIDLAQEGPSLYDPYSSDDEDYPDAIPVRLLRGNGAGKWASVLKLSSGTVSPENVHQLYLYAEAPSQQSFYHRQEVLRI